MRRVALGLVGYLLSQLHLRVFDRRFFERGSLQRLLGRERHRRE